MLKSAPKSSFLEQLSEINSLTVFHYTTSWRGHWIPEPFVVSTVTIPIDNLKETKRTSQQTFEYKLLMENNFDVPKI